MDGLIMTAFKLRSAQYQGVKKAVYSTDGRHVAVAA